MHGKWKPPSSNPGSATVYTKSRQIPCTALPSCSVHVKGGWGNLLLTLLGNSVRLVSHGSFLHRKSWDSLETDSNEAGSRPAVSWLFPTGLGGLALGSGHDHGCGQGFTLKH